MAKLVRHLTLDQEIVGSSPTSPVISISKVLSILRNHTDFSGYSRNKAHQIEAVAPRSEPGASPGCAVLTLNKANLHPLPRNSTPHI